MEDVNKLSNGKIFFLFLNLDMVDRIQLRKSSLAFDKIRELEYYITIGVIDARLNTCGKLKGCR